LLLLLTLLFLFLFPHWFRKWTQSNPKEIYIDDNSDWTGVITVWDIPYVRTGKGSHLSWLNTYIRSFEKKYPGVFIDVRTITFDRLAMYLHCETELDIMPDIISLGIYEQPLPDSLLTDLSPYFSLDELDDIRSLALQRVKQGEKMIGVPWMMGNYGLYISHDALLNEEVPIIFESIDYETLDFIIRNSTYDKKVGSKTVCNFGFCTYFDMHTRPLLSMVYLEDGKIGNDTPFSLLKDWQASEKPVLPPGMMNMTYSEALSLFAIEKRIGVFLGDTRTLYDLRKLKESGKGIDFHVSVLPKYEPVSGQYMDNIAAYALLEKKEGNEGKKKLSILFLKGLINEETQRSLKSIGMFSVLNNIKLYESETDPEMKLLEDSLDNMTIGPFGNHIIKAKYIWDKIQ
jgi:multiple sugar transport system substrate-binding protein